MEHHHSHDEDDGISPKLTAADIKKFDPHTLPDGRLLHPALPELKTNAKQAMIDHTKLCPECRDSPHLDRGGHAKNRELAEKIKALITAHKPHDKDGPHFIFQWRLYANKEHPRFKETDGCGCGCGSDTLGHL